MSKKEKEQMQVDGIAIPETDDKEISTKSTKNEILEAYQKLLGQIKDTKEISHQDMKKKQDEVKLVTKAAECNPERIITNIAEVKTFIGNSLELLEQRLVPEYRRLHELQEAIRLEEANLEEIHQIKININTLNALLLAQKEYKANFEQLSTQERKDFEQHMLEKRASWKKEQDDAEIARKERTLKTQKERERDEEEYSYNVQLERKKDHDAYQAKKTVLERELTEKKVKTLQELAEREKTIAASETELKSLRESVAAFHNELERAVTDAENKVRENVERTYKYQMELAAKELEGERKLNHQIISNMQSKIKEQENFINQLTQKANDAGLQVQAIALKALDGSMPRYCNTYDEAKKGSQQER